MRDWKPWDWIAYFSLVVATIILAAETGVRLSPHLLTHIPEFIDSMWWGFAPVASVVLATVILLARDLGYIGLRKVLVKAPIVRGMPLWLEQLVSKDEAHISWRLMMFPQVAANHQMHLDAVNPYIDLAIPFVNASVFSLTPVRAEGRFRVGSSDLQLMPELLSKFEISHAARGELVLRQWFTPEASKGVLANLPIAIEAGSASVCFSFTNSNGEVKEGRAIIASQGASTVVCQINKPR